MVFDDANRRDCGFGDLVWCRVDADRSLSLGLARLVAVWLNADGRERLATRTELYGIRFSLSQSRPRLRWFDHNYC